MQAAAAGPAWFMFLMLFGAPVNVPLSLPPLPEDAVLAKMAPEQCVWYMSLSGVDKANPASQNKLEQLLAEEDVQHFMRDVSTQLKAAFANAVPNDPMRKTLGTEGPKLVETLLTRPMCAYLASVSAGPHGPTIRAGLAVNLGDDVAKTKESLAKIEAAISVIQPDAKPAVADEWHTIPTPPDAPKVQWTIKDKYLLVGIGEGEGELLWSRSRKQAPEWLTKLRSQLPVERPAMVQYANLETIINIAKSAPDAAAHAAEIDTMLMALGLKNVKSVGSVSGLEKECYVSRSMLATDGPPAGLLSLVGAKGLDAAALDPIPADANFAVAARVDPTKTFDTLLNSLEIFEHAAPASVEQGIQQLAMMTGVNIKTDVIDSLGDTWCVYNSPGDGGLIFTGVTLTATIRDRDKLIQANDRLITFAKQAMAREQFQQPGNPAERRPQSVTVADFQYRGQKVQFVNFIGVQSVVAPAWCITDKQFVIALYPQMIKAYLDRQAAMAGGGNAAPDWRPISSLPEVAQCFSGDARPTLVSYQDTRSTFRYVYPMLQIFAEIAFSELQRQGIDLNISMLPSARSIAPHLMPSVTTVQTTKDGVRVESRGTPSTGAAVLPMSVAMLLPATQAARGAATRAQSMNNMKQIALAMLNFEDVKKTFPPAFVASKDGKPLLSWRVMILPFIEENDLFSQFKLDEPWDSENNKKLIEKMPASYAAPGSKVAGEFKTVYQTIRAKDSAFPGDKGMKLAAITDGTSRTVMAVEASDDKAVIWTKPDDFEVEANDPVAGLVGLREGGFLAVFCDGHVEFVPQFTAPETIKAIFTRNGGEVVTLP